jgi:hypothetical protein
VCKFRCHWCFLFAITLIPLLVTNCACQSNEADSLKPLLEVLAKNRISGSLEFSGSCESLRTRGPEFPHLSSAATSEKSAIDEVRYLFRENPEIGVWQDADGTMRVLEYGTADDILNLQLESVSFGSANVYSPNQALTSIQAAPEVRRYMTAHGIEWPYLRTVVSSAFAVTDSTPHISGTLANVTVSQALEGLLRAFPGVWIYQNCPATDKWNRVVYFLFYPLPDMGRGRVVQ